MKSRRRKKVAENNFSFEQKGRKFSTLTKQFWKPTQEFKLLKSLFKPSVVSF